MSTTILLLVLITTFFQVLHCFEEIGMDAYELVPKPGNKRGYYLRAASVLVGLNFLIAFMLLFDIKLAYYLAFYTVAISVGNAIIHIYGYIKAKSYRATLGAGVFSGIPLGLSGIVLFLYLIRALV
ncbi:MAG: HXXEE domain-containing protein [Clostridia bacterium]|nr:HXXEE domain-containing protein [Clostridia bacterium]